MPYAPKPPSHPRGAEPPTNRVGPKPPAEPHPDDLPPAPTPDAYLHRGPAKQADPRGAPPTPTPEERHAYAHAQRSAVPPSAKTLDDLDDTPPRGFLKRMVFGKPVSEEVKKIRRARATDHRISQRAGMAMVAVLFLWMTSLSVARTVVNAYVVGPDFNCVVEEVESAGVGMYDEKQRYEECAERKVKDCEELFFVELEAEKIRASVALDANAETLESYDATRLECNSDLVYAAKLLDVIQTIEIDPKTGANVDLRDNFTTDEFETDVRCVLVDELIAGQGAALGALRTSANFQLKANAQQRSLLDDIDERRDYDAEYLYNKTNVDIGNIHLRLDEILSNVDGPFALFNASYDLYVACMTTGEYEGVACDGNLIDQFESMLEDGRAQFDNVYNSAKVWSDNAKAKADKAAAWIRTLAGDSDLRATIDALLGTFTLGSTNLNSLGWNLISHPISADISIPTFSTPGLENAYEDIKAEYLEQSALFKAKVEEEMRAVEELRKQLRIAQLAMFNETFFDDYDPPVYNTSEGEAVWKQGTAQFLPGMANDLNTIEREAGDDEGFKSTKCLHRWTCRCSRATIRRFPCVLWTATDRSRTD